MSGMLTETAPEAPPLDFTSLDLNPRRAPFDGRPIKKTVWTLNIGPEPGKLYAPEICQLTYPLLKGYAAKIGADFQVITERKFPDWPVVYEKLQLHELGQCSDWNLYIDSDALVSPEFFDITNHLSKDTICHNGRDMAGVRWKYDQYFRRDGRHWGSCNWFTVASDWCLDVWKPLDDLTLAEALTRINITIGEHNSGQCKTEHLIDDYTLSRNIARFSLKATTVMDICGTLGWRGADGRGQSIHLFHLYTLTEKEKIRRMLGVLATPNGQPIVNNVQAQQLISQGMPPDAAAQRSVEGVGWGLMDPAHAGELAKKWGIKG